MVALMQKQKLEVDIIESVLNTCVQQYATDDARMFTVFDRLQGHFLVIEEGWVGPKRLYNSFVHIEIRDGIVSILQDFTNEGIANGLAQSGIDPLSIVLEYRPPVLRADTEFTLKQVFK